MMIIMTDFLGSIGIRPRARVCVLIYALHKINDVVDDDAVEESSAWLYFFQALLEVQPIT